MQSVLEHMLLTISGKLIGLKYSPGNESLKDEYHRWFAITNTGSDWPLQTHSE